MTNNNILLLFLFTILTSNASKIGIMTESLKLFDTYEEYLDAHLVDEDLYYLKGYHDPNFVQT